MYSALNPKSSGIVLSCLVLAACDTNPSPSKSPANLPELAKLSLATPISCRFVRENEHKGKRTTSTWLFFRRDNRTESRDEATRIGEIWERDDQGRLSMIRVFHNEKVALEFSNGDLIASDTLPTWPHVWSVIEPKKLGTNHKLNGSSTTQGLVIEHYTSSNADTLSTIDWIPSLQLPMTVMQSSGEKSSQLTLERCEPTEKSVETETTNPVLLEYRHLDFSDLGDMESDPVVQRITALMGGHHHGDSHEGHPD